MSILNILSGIIAFLSLIALIMCFMESRYPRRKTTLLCLLVLLPLSAIVSIFYIVFGSEKGGQFFLLIYTLPTLTFFWYLSRYRDGRVPFSFFFAQNIVVEVILLTNIPDAYLSPDSHLVNFLGRLILFPLICYVSWHWVRKPFFWVLRGMDAKWGGFALLTALYGVAIVLMFNYPTLITTRPAELPAMLIFLFLLPLTYFLLFSALLWQLQLSETREREMLLQLQATSLQRQMEQTAAAEKQLSIQRHDLRHRFQTLHTMLEQGEIDEALVYVNNSTETLAETKPQHWCENTMLNATFSAYFSMAEAEGIRIEASLDIPASMNVSATDLSTVFANALENAIQAVRLLPQEQRVIRCKCIRRPQLMFSISNPCADAVRFDDEGRPVVSKKGHGLGTASIAAYCKKHGAFCEYEAEDGWFTFRMVQP